MSDFTLFTKSNAMSDSHDKLQDLTISNTFNFFQICEPIYTNARCKNTEKLAKKLTEKI